MSLSLITIPGVQSVEFDNLDYIYSIETLLGFEVVVVGFVAFVLGVIFVNRRDEKIIQKNIKIDTYQRNVLQRKGGKLIIIGILAFFILSPILRQIPSADGLGTALSNLQILGACILVSTFDPAKNVKAKIIFYAGLLIYIPIFFFLTGFLGFIITWIIVILLQHYCISKRGWIFFLVVPVILITGFTVLNTYMSIRTDLREVVWDEDTSLLVRLDKTTTLIALTDFESSVNTESESSSTLRLNQNYLIGLAVSRIESGANDFLLGESLIPLWLIPRIFWPNKEAVAGGSKFVNEATGLDFGDGTTVGVSHVLELFSNFGIGGVAIGLFLFGAILCWLDKGFAKGLRDGNVIAMSSSFLPGICIVQGVGNSISQTLVALVASNILVFVWKRIVKSAPSKSTWL
jgi:hypothetical protein